MLSEGIIMIKNEEYIVEVIDINANGGGVAKYEGMAVFIPGAVPGDVAKVKIIKVAKSYAVGKLLELVEASEHRAEPPCVYAAKCGGCVAQHIKYEFQLKYKQKQVKDCLERIGKIREVEVLPTIAMENPIHYRNKAQYPIREVDGKIQIGFYAAKSHQVVDIEDCVIGNQKNGAIVDAIRKFLKDNKISIYNEATHKGLARHLVIRNSINFDEAMVCLVINGKKLPHAQDLVERLRAIPGITGILLNHNTAKGNVILAEQTTTLDGRDYIMDKIGELTFKISLLSFFQVNPVQTKVLYDIALGVAALTGSETVLDAYCGIGTISLFLAKEAKRVVGVEAIPQAVANANENAQINGIANVEFVLGNAEDVVLGEKFDVVVVDPPRKGCEEDFLKTIVANAPAKMVYISCDPATLARDVKFMYENGYVVNKVQPVDMFPYTSHVETCVLLSRLTT